MRRLSACVVGPALFATTLHACSPSADDPATANRARVLGTREDSSSTASIDIIAIDGDRIYGRTAGNGTCPSGIFAATSASQGDVPPALETLVDPSRCAGGFGIEDGTIYTSFALALRACPLDAPCDEGRSIAPVDAHVFAVGVSAGKAVVLAATDFDSSYPASLRAFDLATGEAAKKPLAQFEANARPTAFVVDGGYAYYVRVPSTGSSSVGADQTLERVAVDGSAPPTVLASGLTFVTGLAVDAAGVVFVEGAAGISKVRAVPLGGGDVTTITEVPTTASVRVGHALTATTVVVARIELGMTTFTRHDRGTGAELARNERLPFEAAPRFLASDRDVTFGGVDPSKRSSDGGSPQVAGVVVRAPLGGR